MVNIISITIIYVHKLYGLFQTVLFGFIFYLFFIWFYLFLFIFCSTFSKSGFLKVDGFKQLPPLLPWQNEETYTFVS